MSDDEDAPYIKKTRTIHYGSLEEAEKVRLTTGDGNDNSNEKPETSGPPNLPQVHISTGTTIHNNIIILLIS